MKMTRKFILVHQINMIKWDDNLKCKSYDNNYSGKILSLESYEIEIYS